MSPTSAPTLLELTKTALVPLTLKFFFLLTPFFVFSVFLSMTTESTLETKQKLAIRIAIGAAAITIIMFLGGSWVLKLFDITVEAFRAGSGTLLLLVAVTLVNSTSTDSKHTSKSDIELMRCAVVPLAVPITAGPATLGTVMVMGHEMVTCQEKFITSLAILLASSAIGLMLCFSTQIVKCLGYGNIAILSKITGLILCAISISMIVTGIHALWYSVPMP